jgi:hypothetical protein
MCNVASTSAPLAGGTFADNSGAVPIQFMYSNRVNGPEDPTL